MSKNTDIEGYYFEGDITRRQMKGLAYFAEKFADPEFELGHYPAMAVTTTGPRKPPFILSDLTNDFITFCITERVVDLRLADPAEGKINWGKIAMGGTIAADATPYDLILLITHILGNKAHWESRFIKAFQLGLLQQVLDRSVAWAYPEKAEGPLLEELTY
jgi:hypothetical protein